MRNPFLLSFFLAFFRNPLPLEFQKDGKNRDGKWMNEWQKHDNFPDEKMDNGNGMDEILLQIIISLVIISHNNYIFIFFVTLQQQKVRKSLDILRKTWYTKSKIMLQKWWRRQYVLTKGIHRESAGVRVDVTVDTENHFRVANPKGSLFRLRCAGSAVKGHVCWDCGNKTAECLFRKAMFRPVPMSRGRSFLYAGALLFRWAFV